jgi:hypothetical protein
MGLGHEYKWRMLDQAGHYLLDSSPAARSISLFGSHFCTLPNDHRDIMKAPLC